MAKVEAISFREESGVQIVVDSKGRVWRRYVSRKDLLHKIEITDWFLVILPEEPSNE